AMLSASQNGADEAQRSPCAAARAARGTSRTVASCPAMTRFLSFLPFLAAVAAVGAFGAWFEPGPWYAALQKPAWTPPGWVFGPVWTVLYVLIAVAGWLVWRVEGLGGALIAWIVQLVLNGTWSFAMF